MTVMSHIKGDHDLQFSVFIHKNTELRFESYPDKDSYIALPDAFVPSRSQFSATTSNAQLLSVFNFRSADKPKIKNWNDK